MTNYTVAKRIAVIEDTGSQTIELNLIKWGNNGIKYDLRHWVGDEPLKGICFNTTEANKLLNALLEELR